MCVEKGLSGRKVCSEGEGKGKRHIAHPQMQNTCIHNMKAEGTVWREERVVGGKGR